MLAIKGTFDVLYGIKLANKQLKQYMPATNKFAKFLWTTCEAGIAPNKPTCIGF